jgi:integrase
MRINSEGPIKITKATVDAAWKRRQKDTRLIVRDLDCRGLSLIVNATTMVWSYAYRPRGEDPVTKRRWPNKTMTLGNPGNLSPDDARAEANRIKGQAAAGADPAADKKERAAKQQRERAATLGRLLETYRTVLPRRRKMRGDGYPSPGYVAEELAQAGMAIGELKAADTPAAKLAASDIVRLLNEAEGVTTGRKRFSALSRFLDWCVEEGHAGTNPCDHVAKAKRPKAPKARSDYLEPAELARLWHAAGLLHEPVWRDLVRFLIALPCRRGEATALDWSHIDLAKTEWRQPEKMTKNRDPHRLHLHPLALAVLQDRLRAWSQAEAGGDPAKAALLIAKGAPKSGLVFPAPRSGGEIDTFTNIKAALLERTKPDDGDALAGWTWHDFRRSFVTAPAEAGIPEAVADAMLNHRQSATRGGVLGVYQRSSRWPEQVRAMELWGRLLSAAIDGREAGAEVVQLQARTG